MATGIVCEFNPFHNGHLYLLEQARALCGSDIFCAMSGDFVQRGSLAAYKGAVRAGWAIKGGADVVAEIPYPFSCATAEKYAAAAISIINGSGICQNIAFGVETQDLCARDFFDTAHILLEKNCRDGINKAVKNCKDQGFAALREQYVRDTYGDKYADLLSMPNTLLGVEYAKAILAQNSKLDITVIPRTAPHSGSPCGNFCSASYLRKNPTPENLIKFCPPYTAEYMQKTPPAQVDYLLFYAALRQRLMFDSPENLAKTAEIPHDYVPKLVSAAKECGDFESFFEKLKSRHMTNAKLRRMLMCLITHTCADELAALPQSAFLLAYSQNGASMLKSIKKSDSTLFVMSRLADIKKLPQDQRLIFEKQLAAQQLFSSFCRN